MSPFAIWLAAEAVKITLNHLVEIGKLENLSEDEAKAKLEEFKANLSGKLPTPEELEKPKGK